MHVCLSREWSPTGSNLVIVIVELFEMKEPLRPLGELTIKTEDF